MVERGGNGRRVRRAEVGEGGGGEQDWGGDGIYVTNSILYTFLLILSFDLLFLIVLSIEQNN